MPLEYPHTHSGIASRVNHRTSHPRSAGLRPAATPKHASDSRIEATFIPFEYPHVHHASNISITTKWFTLSSTEWRRGTGRGGAQCFDPRLVFLHNSQRFTLLTTSASDLVQDSRTILPLPKGEGRGEGEGDLLTPVEVVSPKCNQKILPLLGERARVRADDQLNSCYVIHREKETISGQKIFLLHPLHWLFYLFLFFLFSSQASAHLGSPDVFFDGNVGPYPARITIRMPTVVPGRAEIITQVQAAGPVDVFFLPLYARTAVSNAPPADPGQPVRGETNLYTGELWLMSFGAYSIEVKIHGPAGEGSVEIPVTSVATSQLPLPQYLGNILLALGAVLVFGGLAIVVGAVRDSTLPPGAVPDSRARWKGRIAGTITFAIVAFLLVGGWRWWNSEERDFRQRLRGGAWPDMEVSVRTEGSQRILELTLGQQALASDSSISLLPDHGKLLHLFLIREGTADAIGHIHPVRKKDKTFQVAIPPLPEGRYKIFCDLTLSPGLSFTATNSIQIPPLPAGGTNPIALEPDPDDSWATYPAESIVAANTNNVTFTFPTGQRVIWKAHPPLRAHQDAGLQFEILDASGNPVPLEPYMGMMSHVAVMRRDEGVFAHLHPMGNFSMAAQGYFQSKLARESGKSAQPDAMADMPGMAGMAGMSGMDHSKMGHMMHPMAGGASLITLPYEFPTPGDYRLWVQFKTADQVMTAVFDATVAP
jgi:hypothetical protein